MKLAGAYGIALVLFLILDGIWLSLATRAFYQPRIGELLSDQPRWVFAGIFYVLYIVGLVYFAVSVGLEQESWRIAALNGALFGFFTYLTYNATNLAVMKGYDTTVAVVDTAWGTLLGAAVAGGCVALHRMLAGAS